MWRGAPAAVPVRVQAKLNRLDGVTASVNLSTERAWVSAPPNLSPRDLVDVVEAVGYTAEVAAPPGAGPLPGVWTLTFDVALGPADAYATSASYRVW